MIKGILKKDVTKLLVEQRKQINETRIRKSDIYKALVEERKKMRVAYKESKFKQRTLNIYKNQVVRATELGKTVDYTLEQFREFVRERLEIGRCFYCEERITVNSFVGDHADPISRGGEFTLDNLAICCKPCNCQKGKMNVEEFVTMGIFVGTLPDDVARDFLARLTTGGKWMQH